MVHDERLSVVVLGSSGFVGRHVCEAFAGGGADVLGVARSEAPPGAAAPTVRLDLSRASRRQVAALLRERAADVVVNAAGAVWGVTDDQLTSSNVELTGRVVDALSTLERPPRLVHLGSVHEYGVGAPGTALTEEHPTRPAGRYGHSKLLATRAVLDAVRERELDAVVLRISNVCGPHAPRASLLGMIATHLAAVARHPGGAAAAPLRLSPLRAHRDFVDVRDVGRAVVAAVAAPLDAAGPDQRVVNIGSGNAVSVRQLVDRLIALSGLDGSVVEEYEAADGRPGAEWQRVDITRARRLLGWLPRCPLDQSLRDLLAAAVPPPPEPDASIRAQVIVEPGPGASR
ncbi:NAD-dependent epimerase/dehydratase family protein [Kitasatospora sp. NPDC101157]|uniref:NAD-dependent epimerase/dehydratase family protein n=1 Tax=Kitasatospora sp. NPDC101157 TaxID=3364098 RepID=UPI0038106B31